MSDGLSANRRLLLVKRETTYGEDSLPNGANALMVSSLDGSPAEAETTERESIRGYYGQSERLMTQIFAKLTFDIELAGHSGGVVGGMPKINDVLLACGMVGEQIKIPVDSIVRVGNVATADIGPHTYKVGNKLLFSGVDQAAYNGIKVLTAVGPETVSFAVAGDPETPATGVMEVAQKYVYKPISNNIPSNTFYYNVDGVLHKITGALGTMSLEIGVKNIPKLKFDFTGKNNPSADVAAVAPDFADFTIPEVANTQNTTGFELLGFGAALETLSLALNNEVTYRALIGKDYIAILQRKVNGSMSFEATTIAEKNYWQDVKDQQTGVLKITHGSQHGNKVSLYCGRVLLDSPKYAVSDNVMMLNMGVSVMPINGNDEFSLSFE